MVLMVEQNRGEHLIRRLAGQGNEPDPCDVKIASLKQRIQELEFSQLHRTRRQKRRKLSLTSGTMYQRTSILLAEETLVEEESCPVYDIDNEEEKSMPVYDTDIEDVIEEEKGFVGKGGFGGEEDNIKDIVVVTNDLCSLMIQPILSVDFEKDINTKSHELMSFDKSIIIK
nr:hypothetical protein [Tanacetum cinerariifolium]